jgi:hypothetical protein
MVAAEERPDRYMALPSLGGVPLKTELALLAAAGATAVFPQLAPLLAQAAPPILDPGLSSLIGNLGVVGVLIWHLYYSTQASPRMLDKFAAEAAQQREANRADREADRALFRQEQESLRQQSAREMDSLRAMLMENLRESRRAVHDIRDVAQTVVAKAGEAVARKDNP